MIVAAPRGWVDRHGQVPLRVDWDRGMAKRRGHTDKLERLNAHPSRVPSPTAVLARFGSWQAALSAAGYQARYVPRPNRIGAEGLQQTAALYASGRSTLELAEHFGVAPKSIRDRFEVGQDVDLTSRATITVRAAAREIRESSRIVARAVLKPTDVR